MVSKIYFMKIIEIKMEMQGVCMCKVEGADQPSYPVYILYYM